MPSLAILSKVPRITPFFCGARKPECESVVDVSIAHLQFSCQLILKVKEGVNLVLMSVSFGLKAQRVTLLPVGP